MYLSVVKIISERKGIIYPVNQYLLQQVQINMIKQAVSSLNAGWMVMERVTGSGADIRAYKPSCAGRGLRSSGIHRAHQRAAGQCATPAACVFVDNFDRRLHRLL